MPFVSVKVLKGVLDVDQKKEIARRIPQVIEDAKGAKGFGKYVWVVVEEVPDFWGIGGEVATPEDVEKMLQEQEGQT